MGFIIFFIFNVVLASGCLIAVLALTLKLTAEGGSPADFLLLLLACLGALFSAYMVYKIYKSYISGLDESKQEGGEANCFDIWDYDEEAWKQLLKNRVANKFLLPSLLAVVVFVGILGPALASEWDPLFLGLLIVVPPGVFGAMLFYQSAKRKRLEVFSDKRLYFYPSSIKFAEELLVFQAFGISLLNILYDEEKHVFAVLLRVRHNRGTVDQQHLFPVPPTVSPERVRALLAKYKEVFAIS